VSGFTPATVREMKGRSRGICEGCGLAAATEAHHRQYRSRGGSDRVENALHLCGSGNHTGCHGIAHSAEGEARGWSVRSGHDPLTVPVRIVLGFAEVWVRFTADGDRELVNEFDAIEQLVLIGARKAA